jgi:hypothetical protein
VVSLALAAVAIASWVREDPTAERAGGTTGSAGLDEPGAGPAGADQLLADAPARAAEAGCSNVAQVEPYPDDRDAIHVEPDAMPPLASWPSTPPASGPHEGRTLPAGAYQEPPPILPLIHSLEHGAAVVWYAPDAPPPEVDRIAALFTGSGLGAKVIVAPYDYPDEGAAGRLPDGVQAAFVAWHRLQTCERLDIAAAFGFVADHASPTYAGRPYLGEAPEPNVGI